MDKWDPLVRSLWSRHIPSGYYVTCSPFSDRLTYVLVISLMIYLLPEISLTVNLRLPSFVLLHHGRHTSAIATVTLILDNCLPCDLLSLPLPSVQHSTRVQVSLQF